jgi:rod shape-determining protein MreC
VLRGGRVVMFVFTLLVVVTLLYLSSRGTLGPLENILSVPLNLAENVIGGATENISGFFDDVAEFRKLQQRNQDLEEALAVYQAELAQLREKGHDYDRLAALLDYDRQGPEDREYVTCDVIGMDTTGFVRAIQIDCGRRDGIQLLDPVVTELGLVGRVTQVSATGAEVLLLADPNSAINARVISPDQGDTRENGLVLGQLAGDLLMSYLPVDASIQEGDLVMTNGLGQSLPADLLVGQVLSAGLAESELYQEARIRSLITFDRLEIVQVVINFEPVDLSGFQDQEAQTTP